MEFYILAGGKSRRMGRNKAILQLHDRTVIGHVVSAIPTEAESIKIIANDPEPYSYLGRTIIPDVYPGCGPISGIHTGLYDCRGESAFFLACDLPFLSEGLVSRLMADYRGEKALVAESSGGPEPLCGIYSKRCLKDLERRIQRQEFGLQVYLKSEAYVRLLKYSDQELFNMNTPDDFKLAREQWQDKPPNRIP